MAKTPRVTHHTNKGARQMILPNRHALNVLAKKPQNGTINNYSKATPTLADDASEDIFGRGGPKL